MVHLWGGRHLVLAHSVAGVQDDPFARHQDIIWRVVVKAVVGHAAVLQLKQTHRYHQSSFSIDMQCYSQKHSAS